MPRHWRVASCCYHVINAHPKPSHLSHHAWLSPTGIMCLSTTVFVAFKSLGVASLRWCSPLESQPAPSHLNTHNRLCGGLSEAVPACRKAGLQATCWLDGPYACNALLAASRTLYCILPFTISSGLLNFLHSGDLFVKAQGGWSELVPFSLRMACSTVRPLRKGYCCYAGDLTDSIFVCTYVG
jgi:hypothetical protein